MIKPNGLPDPGAPDPLGDGFLYAARLSPEKGLGLLLDAWRRHPDGSLGQLRIAGDGELRPLAEQAAAERGGRDLPGRAGPGRDGRRPARRVGAWWPCPPGTTCCPTVILEAMAAGRPVLGTEVGGIPYLLGVDEAGPAAGWAVKPDPDALAAALPIARADAAAVAPAARDRYVRAFHPDVVTRQLIDIYTGLSGEFSPQRPGRS